MRRLRRRRFLPTRARCPDRGVVGADVVVRHVNSGRDGLVRDELEVDVVEGLKFEKR